MGRILKQAPKPALAIEKGNAVYFKGEKALALVRDIKNGDVVFFDRSSISLSDLQSRIKSGSASVYEN